MTPIISDFLGEVQELLEQIRERDEENEVTRKRLETLELEKTQLLRELEHNNERIEKLEKNKTNEKLIKGEIFVNDETYVQDLEDKLASFKERAGITFI